MTQSASAFTFCSVENGEQIMLLAHYYESLYDNGIHKVLLDTDDIEITKMFLADGISEPMVIQHLRNTGMPLSAAAMVLKVAKTEVKTKENILVSREKYRY